MQRYEDRYQQVRRPALPAARCVPCRPQLCIGAFEMQTQVLPHRILILPLTPTIKTHLQDMRAKVAKQGQLTTLLDEQLDWREEVAAEEASEARQVGYIVETP